MLAFSTRRLALCSASLGLLLAGAGCQSSPGTAQLPWSSATGGSSSAASVGASGIATKPGQAPAGAPRVGVILPSSDAGARWEVLDEPALRGALAGVGLAADIGSEEPGVTGVELANRMVAAGARVLVVSSLAEVSGAAVMSAAQQQGIPVIEYDRLTNGGRANFYVGPDPATVGRILGEGLLRCMRDSGNENGPVALLNGPESDSSAVTLEQGYQQPIQSAGYVIRASENVPGWDAASGGALFERMYTMSNGDLVGVVAADDGLAEAVVAVLDRNDRDGQIPVVGPGASEAALGRVLLGQQCMTVLTSVRQQADAVARLAAAIVDSDGGAIASLAGGQLVDAGSGISIPSALLEPQPIFAADVKAVLDAGLASAARVCAPEVLRQVCLERGILG